ncbi:MAG: TetR/AcrR family transcriptional regulator, lmrAB and yxaGH operons repressor [Mycobacterium sp.]|nr:TetR/AcrR family transcriptional regulator, lmrAB and yxaGH operons repressor [Mycobacterium sp.]
MTNPELRRSRHSGSLLHAHLVFVTTYGVGGDIARLLRTVLASERPTAEIVAAWIDILAAGLDGDQRDGCPIEPIATESVHASVQVRDASARAFAGWCTAVADRLIGDGWPDDQAAQTAQAVIALIEGALILSRIAGDRSALDAAKVAARTLLDRRD